MRQVMMSIVVAAAVITMGGCAKPTQAPEVDGEGPGPAAAAPEATRELIPVKMAVQDKTCYLPVSIALDQGFYEDEGLRIRHQKVVGGIEAAEALVSAQADVGVMGDAPTVIALAQSSQTRLIVCQVLGSRMHRIVVRNDSGIEKPADFEGKRLAIQQGSSTHGAFMRYCDKHGVDFSKIQIVALSPRDFPEAVCGRQVDFIAGSEPWPGNVMAQCKDCHEFANLEGLGSLYPLSILARSEFLEKHPEAAAALIRGTEKANEFIAENPDRAAEILATRSGVPIEREKKAMLDYDWVADLRPEVIESLQITAEFLADQGKISKMPDIAGRTYRTSQ